MLNCVSKIVGDFYFHFFLSFYLFIGWLLLLLLRSLFNRFPYERNHNDDSTS